jgi:hypothetical protein
LQFGNLKGEGKRKGKKQIVRCAQNGPPIAQRQNGQKLKGHRLSDAPEFAEC